jgi:transcriptional regulator with XRE-family HTH domain
MGRRARLKPVRLAEKLLQIRNSLGFSQSQLLKRLGFDDVIDYRRISEFELGSTEPPLPVLLAYARLVTVQLEQLVDDRLDLKLETSAERAGNVRRQHAQKRESVITDRKARSRRRGRSGED